MDEKKRKLAAPCGLYCGACVIYQANQRGETEAIEQMKEQLAALFNQMEEIGHIPGMPPCAEGADLSQIKKEIQEGKEFMCCEGCLSDVVALPCRICGFRECAQKKGISNCSECPEMPCQWVIDFKDDGMPHHADVLVNLERQKEIGIDAWLEEQETKWRCKKCGSKIAWYGTKCPDCQATLTETYGPPLF
jgi:predicted Zn-ribbon and HTH transcriptional regulator